MAKEKDEKKEAPAEKAEVTPEEAAAKTKKRKLLFVIVGGGVLTAGVGAGLAFFLAGGSGEMTAKTGDAGHGDAKAEDHAAAKSEEHGDAKQADGHGEGKGEGAAAHGEAKKAEGDAKGGGSAEPGKAEEGKTLAAKSGGVDFGCTQALTPFHLNLGNPLENRYIRLEVAIEYGCTEETKEELGRRLPQLRDAIIAVTSRKTREFLLGPDGKEQLRKEIHTRVNHYMSRKIDDVFITDILIE